MAGIRKRRGNNWQKPGRATRGMARGCRGLAMVGSPEPFPRLSANGSRSFAGQAPLLVIAIILCAYQLPANIGLEGKSSPEDDGDPKLSTRSKLGRVDFLGGFVLALLILTFLLPLEIGGVKVPWSHPLIPALFTLSGLLVVVFVVVEKRWAREPIIPLKLFTQKDVVAAFAIMALQGGAQFGVSSMQPPMILGYGNTK